MAKKPQDSQSASQSLSLPASRVGPLPTGLIPMDEAAAERLEKIAEAAYRRAQQRNFAPGHDLEDWLDAEKEIDAQLRATS
jgi:hypothetical protein